jgi:hypothetical protein
MKGVGNFYLGTSVVEIVRVYADMNISLLFVNRDGVGDP